MTLRGSATDPRRAQAYRALAECNPIEKVSLVQAIGAPSDFEDTSDCQQPIPGRPDQPLLVAPALLATRSLGTVEGRATLIHAVAHIEFNAINLALDMVQRFGDLGAQFIDDWVSVAREEALHFSLLQDHLHTLGFAYGDFPAHNGLWEMAEKTSGDVLARLALVPRILEARGLDVSPGIRDKLKQAGDHRGAEILSIILRDEIGHVAIGNRWFRHCCAERGLDPIQCFEALWIAYDGPQPRAPFNVAARLQAGFVQEEIDWLERKAREGRPVVKQDRKLQ